MLCHGGAHEALIYYKLLWFLVAFWCFSVPFFCCHNCRQQRRRQQETTIEQQQQQQQRQRQQQLLQLSRWRRLDKCTSKVNMINVVCVACDATTFQLLLLSLLLLRVRDCCCSCNGSCSRCCLLQHFVAWPNGKLSPQCSCAFVFLKFFHSCLAIIKAGKSTN